MARKRGGSALPPSRDERYRGYWIKHNVFSGTWWIEKDGAFIGYVPSPEEGRKAVDAILGPSGNPRGRRRRRNEQAPGDWGPGKDFQSAGPIKTVAALHKLARDLLAHVHPSSVMAAAANSALRSPDYFMSRPEKQAELVDMARRYISPERKGRFGRNPRARVRKRGARRIVRRRRRVTLRGAVKRDGGVILPNGRVTSRRRARRNPAVYSERKAWQAVRVIGKRIGGEDGAALEQLAEYMLEQLGRGVHLNPTLAVFGANPVRRVKEGSGDVQAILYRHKEDGRDYVHPFGKGVSVTIKRDGSTVVRASANARSGVKAIGLADGSVLLKHPTKPIWKDF